jgi:hypothetical protein
MYGMTIDVDIDKKTLTCRLWQISGMPCRHPIAAMASWGLQPGEFVHNWLKMPAFKAAYEEFIRPCRSQHFWTTTKSVAPIPPLIKRKDGRPKKTRRKGEDEGERSGKMKKNTIPMHCGRCQSSKHNLCTCPQPAPIIQNQPVEINSSQSAPTSQLPSM